ncbi:hypothetical protein ABW16_07515 [Mycolicibacter heraklionensis]|uniref:Transmembrane protein n=1 Tax=Mycolicibacter heraklionensis TaxID=512402 RepID=A0ABR5FHS7_9MYCO|nr:hypothetical protein [Mycolicibacter heraklionensis]KLO30097.1 hypothetical protein ABW16_07515 [Mycolicibacter heraklionensis]
MPSLLSTALGAAPIFGGALLTAAAGQLKGPDVRALIKQDLDLLDRLPAEQTQRRADLQRTIDERIDDLVAASDRARALREAALSYQGNWRDVVFFVSSLLFTYVWWHVNHDRGNWLPMFVVLILACIVSAAYALRGTLRVVTHGWRRRR